MLFYFVALKRPDLFEFFGKIVRPMRAKKKEGKKGKKKEGIEETRENRHEKNVLQFVRVKKTIYSDR